MKSDARIEMPVSAIQEFIGRNPKKFVGFKGKSQIKRVLKNSYSKYNNNPKDILKDLNIQQSLSVDKKMPQINKKYKKDFMVKSLNTVPAIFSNQKSKKKRVSVKPKKHSIQNYMENFTKHSVKLKRRAEKKKRFSTNQSSKISKCIPFFMTNNNKQKIIKNPDRYKKHFLQ